jgi:DNA-binding response OmpR family regulator
MMDNRVARILVVDDDQFILDIITEVLDSAGFEVKTFLEGQSVMSFLTDNPADLVLLDIRLPGPNGYQVLKEIHSKFAIPVIMLTGVTEPEALMTSLELGAVDYIKKPFQGRELVARIRAKLRRTRV